MQEFLQKLQGIPPEQRAAEVERYLDVYRVDNHRGGWDPSYDWPSRSEVEDSIARTREFYEQIAEHAGDVEPLRKALETFDREAEQMRKLTAMTEQERMRLPAHEFFPFFGRFNEQLHHCYRAHVRVRLDDITFTTELLGEGGFADIYKAVHKDGTLYALKLFHLPHQNSRYTRSSGEFNRATGHVMQNVRDNFSLLNQRPFLAPVFITGDPSGYPWYLMEYSAGKSVRSLLDKDRLPAADEGRALLTYAQMLSILHESDVCSVDNNWGAVLLEPDDVRICDYDAATSLQKLANDAWGERKFGVPIYKSREHRIKEVAVCKNSDLESLALMADHLVNGNPFINAEDYLGNSETAKKNLRKYPRDRVQRLPKRLRQVVPRLIKYPRDDSLTAQDLISAVKADYGL